MCPFRKVYTSVVNQDLTLKDKDLIPHGKDKGKDSPSMRTMIESLNQTCKVVVAGDTKPLQVWFS